MSGIFGYVGKEECKNILTDGIDALYKRGNELCGVALKIDDELISIKIKGRADELHRKTQDVSRQCTLGIAQTDNAMRCKASQLTSKPSCNNLFAVAIDGYIDNFDDLKRWTGMPFPIVTDEDLLLAMLCVADTDDRVELLLKVDSMLEGKPTYVVISHNEDAIYCKKGIAPLVIGIGTNGFYISSELNAVVNLAQKYVVLDDDEIARVTADRVVVYDSKHKRVKKSVLTMPEESYFENDYPLGDEIYYCPLAVRETFNSLVKNSRLDFDYLKLSRHTIDRLNSIIITGAGSSYNIAKLCAYNFEMLTDIPATAYSSSELCNSPCAIDKNTLVIAVSHRGENMDTALAVKRAQKCGARTIAVTSNVTSYIARLCKDVINPNCDFDSNNVPLRSFVSSYFALSLFGVYVGYKNNVVSELYLNVSIKMAEMISGKVSSSIKNVPRLSESANILSSAECVFVAGYGADYALACEATDKLRSVARINASAYELGELDCTPFANDTVVLAVLTNPEFVHIATRYLRRIKSLGARVVIYTTETIEEVIDDFDFIYSVNDSVALFNHLPCITAIYKTAIIVAQEKKEIKDAG